MIISEKYGAHNYQKTQEDLNFAIADEVDSILIDEARTPLIISGATDDDLPHILFFKASTKLIQTNERGH